MDEKIKQAFETANYMATLADQKRILAEEFDQNTIYFFNGGTFRADRELINFVKTLIDLGRSSSVVVDTNNNPIEIQDLTLFLENILDAHFFALNSYHSKYQKLRSSRTVESLTNI